MLSILAQTSPNGNTPSLFCFQKNNLCTRKRAEEISQQRDITVKEAYQYLLNTEKVNVPKNWQLVERESENFVETLAEYIAKGYTVRLGIKPLDSNSDKDVVNVFGVFLDIDNSSIIQSFSNSVTNDHAAFYYFTPSYIEGSNEKHRIVLVFDRKASNYEARVIIRWLYKHSYNVAEGAIDVSCLDPARLFFPAKSEDDVFEIEYTNRLPVDQFVQIAESVLSSKDLNDCRMKSGLATIAPKESNGSSNSNGSIPGKINLGKKFESTPKLTTPPSPTESKEEGLTNKVDKIVYEKLYSVNQDISDIFCGYDHKFVEVSPDYDDQSKGAVRCWTGYNPWTKNTSGGTSFKVSLLDNDRFIFVARGSGGGEDGGDIRGNIVNYWFNILKLQQVIPQEIKAPEGDFFKLVVEEFFRLKGLEVPVDFYKAKKKKKASPAESFEDLKQQFCELVGDSLAYNELTSRFEIDGEPFSFDSPRVTIQEEFGLWIGDVTVLLELIHYVGRKNSYHPVRRFLESNYEKHQNVDISIIENLSTKYFNTDKSIYDVYMKKILIAAVARVMQPGCKVDTACILQGDQGCGKSTFWQILASKEFFNDSIQFDSANKDELLKINRSWIHELSELDQIFRRRDIAGLRTFITSDTDRYRAPYSRDTNEHPRSSILVGTVNPVEFLNDAEGDRRFWVISVNLPKGQLIDLNTLQSERELIWAAAFKAYINKETWQLTHSEELERISSNADFRVSDTIEESLMHISDIYASITIKQVWERVLFNQGIPTRGEEMRISDALKKMGWNKARKAYKGKFYSVWVNSQKLDSKIARTFLHVLEEDDTNKDF
jgi:predicted P-loop ATPase